MLRSSVKELVDWMYETAGDYDMAPSMSTYLVSQRELSFGQDRGDSGGASDELSEWTQLVEETNSLDWDFLLEGKISKQWILFARRGLERTSNSISPEGWTKSFINELIRITHQL